MTPFLRNDPTNRAISAASVPNLSQLRSILEAVRLMVRSRGSPMGWKFILRNFHSGLLSRHQGILDTRDPRDIDIGENRYQCRAAAP